MKAKVKFPTAGNEAYWKKAEDGKVFAYITVTDGSGGDYRVKVVEGTPEFAAAVGAEIDIEIKDAPADGKPGFAYIAGQAPQKKFGGGGGNFAPRKTYTVAEVGKTAEIAARLAAHTYTTLRNALTEKGQHDATAEDVRTMTNTIIIELMKRLP
jgi:hypothetical protein